MTQCFQDLGEPGVTHKTFWTVYHGLRDLVERTIPDRVMVTLSTRAEDEAEVGAEPFPLAHLKEPDLGVSKGGKDGDRTGALGTEDVWSADEDENYVAGLPHVQFTSEG